MMKELYTFDAKNYEQHWQRFRRESVRAIIMQGDLIMMIKCGKAGYYKFPGGGMHYGETHYDTLVREVLEGTGLEVVPGSVVEYGMMREIRKGFYDEEIFDQFSYYYLAQVTGEQKSPKMDDYQKDLQCQMVMVTPQEAYETNMRLGRNYISSFLLREAYILKQLIDNKQR